MPRLTRIDIAVRICSERAQRRVGPHELALLLGIARSTIYAVLRRAELHRLGALVAKRPVLRYEWPQPGDLVHLDVKRFGRIPEAGGWRNLGRRLANAVKRHAGYEYCHVAVDDHSRLPDALLLSDQRGASAVRALEQLWGRYLRAGVRIRRVLTDNGSCYRSLDFRAACERLGIAHWRTKPYTPRTNGEAERFIKTLQERWAYVRLYRSSAERARGAAGLPRGVQSPPLAHARRPHAALPLLRRQQPVWESQLARYLNWRLSSSTSTRRTSVPSTCSTSSVGMPSASRYVISSTTRRPPADEISRATARPAGSLVT